MNCFRRFSAEESLRNHGKVHLSDASISTDESMDSDDESSVDIKSESINEFNNVFDDTVEMSDFQVGGQVDNSCEINEGLFCKPVTTQPITAEDFGGDLALDFISLCAEVCSDEEWYWMTNENIRTVLKGSCALFQLPYAMC